MRVGPDVCIRFRTGQNHHTTVSIIFTCHTISRPKTEKSVASCRARSDLGLASWRKYGVGLALGVFGCGLRGSVGIECSALLLALLGPSASPPGVPSRVVPGLRSSVSLGTRNRSLTSLSCFSAFSRAAGRRDHWGMHWGDLARYSRHVHVSVTWAHSMQHLASMVVGSGRLGSLLALRVRPGRQGRRSRCRGFPFPVIL